MIEDARMLPEGFVPSDVVHRDGKVNALSRVLESDTNNDPSEPALITGHRGLGRRQSRSSLSADFAKASLMSSRSTSTVGQSYSRFKPIYCILEGVGRTVNIHRQSIPHDELLDRLADYDGPLVIVTLDEVDQLDDVRLVYDLYRLEPFSFVLITNDEEELLTGIDDRVRSRMETAEMIHFDRYSIDD